jgi:Rod binding domain-containing protein
MTIDKLPPAPPAIIAPAAHPQAAGRSSAPRAEEPMDKNSPEYQAAKGFEIHFMQEMMRNMRKTVPENPDMANNQGYHIFRDMLDDHYAESASRTQGIGLAEMIVKQLHEQQANARGHQPVAVRDVNKSDVIKK